MEIAWRGFIRNRAARLPPLGAVAATAESGSVGPSTVADAVARTSAAAGRGARSLPRAKVAGRRV
jgi:hypothetical protein